MAWPALKWSADDKFVARVTPSQQISVYELPSMGLQGKKSLKIEGVVDFEWCPLGEKDKEDTEKAAAGGKGAKKAKENMLAYWTPEVANQPARVTVLNFPGRNILRQKNLFNVTEVRELRDLQRYIDAHISSDSVNSTGKIKATSSASGLTVTLRRRSPSSAIWRSSRFAKRISPSRLLS